LPNRDRSRNIDNSLEQVKDEKASAHGIQLDASSEPKQTPANRTLQPQT
jgi:hypothetical protein